MQEKGSLKFKMLLFFFFIFLGLSLYVFWVWNSKIGNIYLWEHLEKRLLDSDVPKATPFLPKVIDSQDIFGKEP